MELAQQIKTEVSLPREIITIFKLEEEKVPSFIRKTLAVELFREKKISLGKAAEIADLSKEAMMGLLAVKKIPLHYTVEELREDVKVAK